MDPWKSAQDVVRCTLCQTSVAPMYCEVCHIHVCKDCVEKHLSDSSIVHNVVSLKQYLSTLNYPKCRKHPTKQCELLCKQCDISICTKCISSGTHFGHKQVDIFQNFEEKKEDLIKELQELEKSIYPKYQEIASAIPMQKADLSKNFQKLTAAINKQGEVWHREIDTIIQKLKSKVEEIESKNLVALNKQDDEITHTISELTQNIADLKKLLDSHDVSRVSACKSRIVEFRKLPPKLNLSKLNFRPREIHTDQLIEQFGSLSTLSFTTEEQLYSMPPQRDESSTPDRLLMDIPRVITAIDTEYGRLGGVTCLSDTEIWTFGNDDMIKLYNIRGGKVKSVQTKSGNHPLDIAVTRTGDLVYTDIDRTVNIVKNAQIQTVIRLRGWTPVGVCSTSAGDLLVVIVIDDCKQSKVVCYSGSTEKLTIQYDDILQPLYSSTSDSKNICENKNRDICVADRGFSAVVVVNQAGKLRFNYTGSCTTKRAFDPCGITTDSQGLILVVDIPNNSIHILDQDGQFLSYINDCHLHRPFSLCVDTQNNLFVAENKSKVKKIQYYM